MRILIVEDDPHTATFIAKGLGEDGHTVDQADNGRDGLFLATTETYDAIILDRMLPAVDGLPAAAMLESRPLGAANVRQRPDQNREPDRMPSYVRKRPDLGPGRAQT